MRVDAHQHYWKIDRGDYGWLTPAAGLLYQDYLPADLKPILDREGIDQTVAVQAAPSEAETRFLLELAEREETIAGVVGWLDMEAGDFEARLDAMLRHPKFKGIRPMIQDHPDDAWMLRPAVQRAFRALEERDVPFDFLTYTRHLPYVLTVVEKHPRLRCVIDHLSKPPIRSGETRPWAEWMRRIAGHPNVYCKLSGMVTEADHRAWTPRGLEPYVDHVLEVFGPRRLMYGSDWPVCLLAAEYEQVIGTMRDLLADRVGAEDERAIFGGTAIRFYGL